LLSNLDGLSHPNSKIVLRSAGISQYCKLQISLKESVSKLFKSQTFAVWKTLRSLIGSVLMPSATILQGWAVTQRPSWLTDTQSRTDHDLNYHSKALITLRESETSVVLLLGPQVEDSFEGNWNWGCLRSTGGFSLQKWTKQCTK